MKETLDFTPEETEDDTHSEISSFSSKNKHKITKVKNDHECLTKSTCPVSGRGHGTEATYKRTDKTKEEDSGDTDPEDDPQGTEKQ